MPNRISMTWVEFPSWKPSDTGKNPWAPEPFLAPPDPPQVPAPTFLPEPGLLIQPEPDLPRLLRELTDEIRKLRKTLEKFEDD